MQGNQMKLPGMGYSTCHWSVAWDWLPPLMFSRLYQQNITWWSWTKRWALLSSWLPYIGSASLQISADIISKMETHWLSSSSCTSVLYRFLEFGVESSKWINLNKKTLQCPFESKMAFLSTESTWCYDEAKYVSPGKCVSSRFCPNLVHGSCGLLGTCPQVGLSDDGW